MKRCSGFEKDVLIPFYGRYLEYKSYWAGKYYWINFFTCFFSVFTAFLVKNQLWEKIILYFGMFVWVVITAVMRIKTLEFFGQKKILVLLEFLGLGFVLDCICALAFRRSEAERIQDEMSAISGTSPVSGSS